jgi:hypothetical protein
LSERRVMEGIRYANIGLAVAAAVIFPGVLLAKDAGEAVIVTIGFVGSVLGAAVYNGLYERNRRRQERDQ